MLLKCDSEWEEKVISYIGNDYKKCLYLYIDIKKYGLSKTDFLTAYVNVDSNMRIKAVILLYYTGMHIYSKTGDFDVSEVVDLIDNLRPTIICGEKSIIERIHQKTALTYKTQYGAVKEIKECESVDPSQIYAASVEDVSEMTAMLHKNGTDGYTFQDRYNQILGRITDQFSRNYLVFIGDELAGQISTGGEIEDVAVVAGLHIKEKFRRRGLASKLTKYLSNELLNEGKEVYIVCYGEMLNNLYESIGFKTCTEWGKMNLEISGNK